MTRSRGRPPTINAVAPLDAAMTADEQATADVLSEILEAIAPFDQGTVKGVLYQKPQNGQGAWKWIDEVFPPFDLSAIYNDMKENYGGGDYQLRIMAQGKPRKNHDFTIIKQRPGVPVAAPQPAGLAGSSEFLQFFMAQALESRREAAAAAERQATMFNGLIGAVVPALIPLLAGRQGQTSETVALITALQDRKAGGAGGLKETLEAMAAFKALMGDGGGGEEAGGVRIDPDNLVASMGGLVGPGLRALSDFMARQREAGAPSASGAAAAVAGGGQLALGAPASRFRLLDLVRDDLTYMFARGFEPEKVADLVYDVIEANNVTEAEINEVGAAFALSPTGLADLAREGIDLTSNPQWANDFFAALLAIHQGETDDSDGREGGAPDASADGAPGAGGPT